jgi:hypothetical protein
MSGKVPVSPRDVLGTARGFKNDKEAGFFERSGAGAGKDGATGGAGEQRPGDGGGGEGVRGPGAGGDQARTVRAVPIRETETGDVSVAISWLLTVGRNQALAAIKLHLSELPEVEKPAA